MNRVVEKKEERKWLVILLSLLVIACVSVIFTLPFYFRQTKSGHDLAYHFGAIYSLKQALEDGSFGSRIYEYTCMDYGYGTGLFYTMIPSGITAILMYIFKIGAIESLTMEVTFLIFISGVICYFFCKRVTQRKWLPLIMTIIYLTFPYIICDFHIRFAFSELFLVPLVPTIAWSLYEFVHTKNYGLFALLFISGFSLSILLHLSLTVYIALLSLLYLLLNFKKAFNKKSVLILCASSVLALLISMIFVIPMFVNYSEISLMDMAWEGTALFDSTYAFLDFKKHYYVMGAGLVLYVVYIAYLVYFIRAKKSGDKPEISEFVTFTVLTFLCSPLCFLWLIANFPPFNMIQFVWRLYLLAALASAFMLWKIYDSHKQRAQREDNPLNKLLFAIFGGVYVSIVLISNVFMMVLSKDFIERDYATGYTMISSMYGCGGSRGDYMPNGATIEKMKKRIGEEIIYETNCDITEVANYKSQKIFSFFVEKSEFEDGKEKGYIILKIPYVECADLKVFQKQVSYPYSLSELSPAEYENESSSESSQSYLKIVFNDSEDKFRVILDYNDAENFDNYLTQDPFEFKVKNKSVTVKFSNFVKTNSHTYSVSVDTSDIATIELPTLFYKGYKVTLKTSTGTKVLDAVHGENGLIEVNVPESGELTVEFEANYIKTADILCICGVCLSVCFVVILFIKCKSTKKVNKKPIKK